MDIESLIIFFIILCNAVNIVINKMGPGGTINCPYLI